MDAATYADKLDHLIGAYRAGALTANEFNQAIELLIQSRVEEPEETE